MRLGKFHFISLIVAAVFLPAFTQASAQSPASQPSSQASIAPIQDSFADQPILRQSDAAPATGPSSATAQPQSFDASHVIFALAGVIGLIFFLRYFARRLIPGTAAHRSTHAMKILSRCTISPRQHLLLVQIGKRMVVVGDSGSQLSSICQITDAVEIEALKAQINEEATAAARRFDMLFGRARKGFDQPANSEVVQEAADSRETSSEAGEDDASEASGGASNEFASADSETPFDPTHEIDDPSLAATQKELSGLSEKVKDLARQLGK